MTEIRRRGTIALVVVAIAGCVGACGADTPARPARQGTSTAARVTRTRDQPSAEAAQVQADYVAVDRGIAVDNGSEICDAYPPAARRESVAEITDARIRTCAQLLTYEASRVSAADRRDSNKVSVKLVSIKGDVATLDLSSRSGTVPQRVAVVADHGHWYLAGPVPTIETR